MSLDWIPGQAVPRTKAVVVVRPGAAEAAGELFREVLNISVISHVASGGMGAGDAESLPTRAVGVLLPRLGTVVALLTPDEFAALRRHEGGDVIEAVYADWVTSIPTVRSASDWGRAPTPSPWALEAMNVSAKSPTGAGVKVAVLDSGFDAERRGFGGPNVVLGSEVRDRSTDDRFGHGTHCAGLVGGNSDASGNRFGVAPGVQLHCCKVMYGQFGDGSVLLKGIEWALDRGCHVILIAQVFSPTGDEEVDFDIWARRALDQHSLIIAAAGNTGPDGTTMFPAAAPSVIAVAAVTSEGTLCEESSHAGKLDGSEINFAAPGEEIYSAVANGRYLNLSGTSMAAAHAAGIAALWIEKENVHGEQLWAKLKDTATPTTGLKVIEAGAGILKAP